MVLSVRRHCNSLARLRSTLTRLATRPQNSIHRAQLTEVRATNVERALYTAALTVPAAKCSCVALERNVSWVRAAITSWALTVGNAYTGVAVLLSKPTSASLRTATAIRTWSAGVALPFLLSLQ